MLIGNKNVKYGLTVPKAKPKAPVAKPLNVFGDDDDSGDEAQAVGRDIARQGARKLADSKVAHLHEAALAEDAAVFDYDGVYDSIQAQRVQPRQAEKLARKSRYIESLMDKAVERKKEEDIIYERKLAKEREAEDHLFGDKERFVTAAYKRKLEEDKVWLAAEKAREAKEAENDVVKHGHMGNFYRNLTKNVAFGGADTSAGPSKKQKTAEVPPAPGGDAAWEAARAARQAFEEGAPGGAAVPSGTGEPAVPGGTGKVAVPGGTGEAAVPGGTARNVGAPSSDLEGTRLASGAAAAGGELPGGDVEEEAGAPTRKGVGLMDDVDNPLLVKQAKLREIAEQRQKELAEKARAKEESDRLAAAEAAEAAPMSKEDRAAAARERYLARKRKAPGGA